MAQATGLLNSTNSDNVNKYSDQEIKDYINRPGMTVGQVQAAAKQYGISDQRLNQVAPGYTASSTTTGKQRAAYGSDNNPMGAPTAPTNTGAAAGSDNNPLNTDTQTLFGAGNPAFTDNQIRSFASQPGMTDGRLARAAVGYGIGVNQLSNAMGGKPGYSTGQITDYLASQGIFNTDSRQDDTIDQQVEKPPIDPRYAQAAYGVQDPATQTVAGQLKTILGSGSPLMLQANTFGDQQANARGLLNSSMGVGAAQDAMIRAGLPIASADAASANQYGLSNLQNEQQTNMFNSDLQRQYDLTRLGISKDMAINAENIARDYGLAGMDIQSKVQIANINAASKSSSDAAGLNDRLLSGINEINGRDISQEAKDAQIRTLVNATDGAIGMLGAFDAIGAELSQELGGSATPTAATGVLGANGRPQIVEDAAAREAGADTDTKVTTATGYTLSGDELKAAKQASEVTGIGLHRIVTKQELNDMTGGIQQRLENKGYLDSYNIEPAKYSPYGSVELWAHKQ